MAKKCARYVDIFENDEKSVLQNSRAQAQRRAEAAEEQKARAEDRAEALEAARDRAAQDLAAATSHPGRPLEDHDSLPAMTTAEFCEI